MSILIQRMEMPDSCIACVFGKEINYAGDFEEKCLVNDKYGYVSVRKPRLETCPLVEVKEPHGRLIDADNMMMSLADWWYSSFGQDETDEAKAIRTVMDKVEQSIDAMIVIEAEGET